MATKKDKSLRAQYAAILAEKGVKIEDCTVLAFVFTKGGSAEKFHYAVLAAEPAVPHLLFDGTGTKAQIVIAKDPNNESRIRVIAEVNRGHRTIPDL